ncbi:hypothetical protein WICPIJ_008224 [Wickerhamomyces pijperi]|uniref:Uncharacterized protein n=1 Tax=Wickerhamomyces pijperi TaxID=599730 RepID=A0A9P8Q0J2_WICPI|nr:hypothetical protein WICPIJ_008224 [Wickerhamomyces pijperi]
MALFSPAVYLAKASKANLLMISSLAEAAELKRTDFKRCSKKESSALNSQPNVWVFSETKDLMKAFKESKVFWSSKIQAPLMLLTLVKISSQTTNSDSFFQP